MHQTVQLFNVNFDSPCGRHEYVCGYVCGYVSMCVCRSVCMVPLEKALGLPSPGGRNRKVSEVNSQKTHIHQTQQHKTRDTHTHTHTHTHTPGQACRWQLAQDDCWERGLAVSRQHRSRISESVFAARSRSRPVCTKSCI